MKKHAYLIILLSIFTLNYSQNIPSDRQVDWSKVGLTEDFIMPKVIINFKSRGGFTDGKTANDSLFNVIKNEISGLKAIIYFPAGKYLFTKSLRIYDHHILKGDGAKRTELLFRMADKKQHLIQMFGYNTGKKSTLLLNGNKGNNYINISNPADFKEDDLIALLDKNPAYKSNSGNQYNIGQIMVINKITANKVYFNNKLRRDFKLIHNPLVYLYNPVEGAGILNLKIKRLDKETEPYSNIYLIYAKNCLIKCVESEYAAYNHLAIYRSSNIEISGCYFHNGFDHVSNYRSHGVMLFYSTSNCLITNNIFEKLKPGVNIEIGANGNVVSYNYFTKPYTVIGGFPSDATGDIWLNGGFAHSNLIEGNVLGSIEVKTTYGINYKNNTFFRNRINKYGFITHKNKEESTHKLNLIGNMFTSNNSNQAQMLMYGSQHYLYGNNVQGTVTPNGTKKVKLKSLYLTNTPPFYANHKSWAPIGYPKTGAGDLIKPELNYKRGIFTFCQNDTLGVTLNKVKNINMGIVYPNPTNNTVYFRNIKNNKIRFIKIYNTNGALVYKQQGSQPINVQSFSNGLFLVNLTYKTGMTQQVKLIKN